MKIHQIPELRNPVAILAFNGWSDAGEAATGAITHLLNISGNQETLIAEMISEDFYDYQQIRPMVFVNNSQIRQLKWPNTNIYAIKTPNFDFDLVVVMGPEPSFKWQTFTNQLLDLFEDLEVDLIVNLGALLADAPHTRPISVTGTSSNPELASKIGFEVSRYEGPTGILGVVQDLCQKRDIDACSIWAALPHYASGSPSPKATLALIEELSDFFEVTLPVGDLPEAAKAWEIAVTQLAEEDTEISDYVKQLELDLDESELEEATGEDIAKEFERFLRRQGDTQ